MTSDNRKKAASSVNAEKPRQAALRDLKTEFERASLMG
jgi:hypothetical protein